MSLVHMSLAGGVMILAVILVRAAALPRVPKRTFPALWCAVLARLLLPLRLPCALSVYTLIERLRAPAQAPAPAPAAAAPNIVQGAAAMPAVTPAVPAVTQSVTAAVPAAPTASVDTWVLLWLAGAAVCAAFFAVVYLRCRGCFRQSLPVEGDFARRWLHEHRIRRKISLRQSDRVGAPLTYGVLRPVILLPKSMDWSDGEAVKCALEHEFAHVRRFDAALKLLLCAAACVHWFNPLVWCMYALANRDIELACDESALLRLGTETRSDYAMALIRMAEAKKGPAPLYSGFGKSPVEERITAIMKIKKTSLAALLVAAGLVVGVTTVFATSAVSEDREAMDRRANSQAVTAADTVLSYAGPDGKLLYSEDGGKTFISEEEYNRLHPETDVVWWTYDEYAAWLENEKVQLQSMLGERGWTGGRGEFVWTQELIDETIAMYEDILAQIGRGVLVSKTVDGSEDVMLMQNPSDMMLGVGESSPTAADFLEYESLGLEWDEAEKALFYNGERVRYFLDGAEVDDFGGMAVRLEYADRELTGEIDLRAVRERVNNADGSYDPMGPLLRLEKCPEGTFEERASSSPALAATSADIYTRQITAESNAETEKLLKKYAPFGLSWEFDSETGAVSMSWNGKTVHSVFDSVEQVWIANNMHGTDLPSGAVDLEAVYKNGRLTGLRELQEQTGAVTAVAEGTGESGGRTFAEIFEKYEREYVIDYVPSENGGRGNLYHLANTAGQPDRYLISHFADAKPDGSVFTFDSDDDGGLSVQTVYGEDGELVWHVVTVTASPVAAPALTSGDKFVRVHGLLYEGYGSSGYVREADLSPDAGLIAMYDMYGSVTGCFDAAGYDYDDHAREPKCRIINGVMCRPAAGHDIGGYGSYRHGYISEDREGMYGAPTDDIDKMAEYLIAHPEYGKEHDIPLYDENGSVIGGFTIGPGNISLPEGVNTIEGAKEYLQNLYQ